MSLVKFNPEFKVPAGILISYPSHFRYYSNLFD